MGLPTVRSTGRESALAVTIERDRNPRGKPEQARPRDALGRPLPYGATGVPPLPEPLPNEPAAAVALAQSLLDRGRPFQAHEVLEEMWHTCPVEQRDGWQGLAQVAVAITHAGRGNQTGTERLLQRATSRLLAGGAALPPPVDSAAILAWLSQARACAASGEPLPAGPVLVGQPPTKTT
jgi:2-keto-4-pentenoate hydratase